MQSHPFRVPALTIWLMVSTVAQADVEITHVDVVCDAQANLALVRFAISFNDDPVRYPSLPQELDRGLSGSSGSDRNDCTLKNGVRIRVRGGREQAFAYGFGGANPPAFFSLWIGRRRVFSRQTWLPGYESSFDHSPTYDGMLIEPGHLTICKSSEDRPQECKSQSLTLKRLPFDPVEYGTSRHKPAARTDISIAKGAVNQQFCSRYLRHMAPDMDGALQGRRSTFNFDWSPQDVAAEGDGGGQPQSGVVELSPDTTRRMMTWGGESHYFDGDVIVLAPRAMTARDIAATYQLEDIETWPKIAAPSGVTLVSGGQPQLYPNVSPRYVHLVPQRIDGAMYILDFGEVEYTSAGREKIKRGTGRLYKMVPVQ